MRISINGTYSCALAAIVVALLMHTKATYAQRTVIDEVETAIANIHTSASSPAVVSITRSEAEHEALKSNPRISASRLLALAEGQTTTVARSNELPQIVGYMTAVKAEDGSRTSAGTLNSSRLFTHAGTGGTLTQLITDFGHTQDQVASAKLLAKSQQQSAVATEQDVLFATDQAFYRLLAAQALLEVAQRSVAARGTVKNLTQTLAHDALKSTLDISIASADYSQIQLLELDAEDAVTSASASLAALLAMPATTLFKAVEDTTIAPPAPPEDAAAVIAQAVQQRPDLQALETRTLAEHKLSLAIAKEALPTISALAVGGVTPVRPDGVFAENWYAAGGVNLSIPLFSGLRIHAQEEEARYRERASASQARDLSDQISRDVQIASMTAGTAFRRIEVTEQFRSQTAQALDAALTRYKLGSSSIVELSQALLQNTQADVAAVNARYNYRLALRSLEYAKGTLAP